jgi:hypothetical protein
VPRHNGASRPKKSRNSRHRTAPRYEPPDKPPKQSLAERNLEWRLRSTAVPQPKENPDAQ